MAQIIASQEEIPFGDRMDWLSASLAEDRDLVVAMEELTDPFSGLLISWNISALETWVEGQPSGREKDVGFYALAKNSIQNSDYQEALELTEKVADPMRREGAREMVILRWVSDNPEAAARELPPEVFEKYQKRSVLETLWPERPD